ncbi:sensor histidine kinase [Microvirga lenta]|uniref:sensor histidine kinase n=1 Tax=Microvirga lenta TaxID=2881337 RepID=UPI001CFFDD6F|nr:ATP-binding protein [Microvirga lenta]MCB5177334.1 histidine kinase [Microvirga lenta]
MASALDRQDGLPQPGRSGIAGMPAGARSLVRSQRLIVSHILAAAIPVLLFGGWMAYLTADQERTEARRAAQATVARVAERVSESLSKELEVAEALAGTTALDGTDLETFYEEAQRLTAARPLWETVSLIRPDGTQVLNILRPLGEPLGPTPDQESFDEIVQGAQSAIGGIGPVGPLSGKRLVSLRVPVNRNGELRYVLTIGLVPSQISAILRDAGAPASWVGVIVDARGNVIARTLAENTEIGQPASISVRDAIRRGSEGFYGGRTLEGTEVETVYRKMPGIGGWSVHFGIPTEALNTPVLRSLAALVAGGVTSLALGGGLALLIARDVAQRRREEEARSMLALSVSEERGAVAVEAADLGTLRWDPERQEVMGSERLRMLLDLPPSVVEGPEAVWSVGRVLAALHPEDRVRMQDAVTRCLEANSPIDIEVRAIRSDGRSHWVRFNGRRPMDSSGAPRVVHGVVSDIEPQKRAEAERLRLLRSLAEAQENEQRRIARELHDQVGQTVTGLSLGLKSLERALESGTVTSPTREQLRWLQGLANEIGRDIHRAASDLRPSAIDDLGLHKALAAYVAEWGKVSQIDVDLQTIGHVRRLPAPIETATYRVVQEALTNVLKHAEARSVSIVLEYRARQLRVLVEDDGRGFDPDMLANDGAGTLTETDEKRMHLGITGMRERLALLGGTLTLESSPGSGTTVFIQVPAPPPGPSI